MSFTCLAMPTVYRDELASARARLAHAMTMHERARARVDEQLEAITLLNTQLVARERMPVDLPQVTYGVSPFENIEALKLPDLVRRAGEVEEEVERLERTANDLARLFSMAQDRVQGRRESPLDLGPPPHALPVSYVISEWLGGISKMAKWTIFFPPIWVLPFGHIAFAASALAIILGFATIRTARRMRLLRWAKVAQQVTVTEEEDTSTSNTNVPMRSAVGWEVTTEAYTGHTQKTTLAYLTEEGDSHALTVRGTGYSGGVVLYDSRRPESAIAIEKFDCTPHPDLDGRWQPRLRGVRVWFNAALGTAALSVLAVALYRQLV